MCFALGHDILPFVSDCLLWVFVVWGCIVYSCALGWDAVSFNNVFRSHNNQGRKYHHRVSYVSLVCLFYVLYFFVFIYLFIHTSGFALALWCYYQLYVLSPVFWVYKLVYFDSSPCLWAHGGVVVKELRYKLAGRGFDSRWWHNPSGHTMALGLTQPLTEVSTRCISWG